MPLAAFSSAWRSRASLLAQTLERRLRILSLRPVDSPAPRADPPRPLARLRRELGVLESYAALIGILVGAGIFRVTSTAYASTGASVILGYVVLAPAVMATSVAYVVFLSTPL